MKNEMTEAFSLIKTKLQWLYEYQTKQISEQRVLLWKKNLILS